MAKGDDFLSSVKEVPEPWLSQFDRLTYSTTPGTEKASSKARWIAQFWCIF